jgi:hypothetical protein
MILRAVEDLKRFFYPNLDGIGYGALSFPVSRTAFMRGFAAGKTMYELTNTFFPSPFFQPSQPLALREFLNRSRSQRVSA